MRLTPSYLAILATSAAMIMQTAAWAQSSSLHTGTASKTTQASTTSTSSSKATSGSAAQGTTGKTAIAPSKTSSVPGKASAATKSSISPNSVKQGQRRKHTGTKTAGARKAAQVGAAHVAAQHAKSEWLGVSKGFALAKVQKKPIVVDFFTDWCGWCKVMERETFEKEAVKKLLESKFISVRANAEDNAEGQKLASETKIEGYPTIVFYSPAGKEISRVVGYKEVPAFLEALNSVLAGDSSGSSHSPATASGASTTADDKPPAK